MPERIEPCLALSKARPPQGDDWSDEIKWDGYRLAVHIEPSGVRIITRGGHDWTHRLPAIAEAAATLGPTTMILDGEAVVLDEQGRSDFGLLQRSLAPAAGDRANCHHATASFTPSTLYISMVMTCGERSTVFDGICWKMPCPMKTT